MGAFQIDAQISIGRIITMAGLGLCPGPWFGSPQTINNNTMWNALAVIALQVGEMVLFVIRRKVYISDI